MNGKALRLLRYIDYYVNLNSYGPTHDEMNAELDMGHGGAGHYLRELEEAQLITRDGTSRSVRVSTAGRRFLRAGVCLDELPETVIPSERAFDWLRFAQQG